MDAAPGHNVPEGAYYLGRPWRPYARVVFQNSEMSSVINPEGWRVWNEGDSTEGIEFGEFNNSGAGAEGPRVDFAKELDAAVAIEEVLGADFASAGYYDAAYM